MRNVVWFLGIIGFFAGFNMPQSKQHVAPKTSSDLYLNITTDYGVQMMLTDSQGRTTGYDRTTGHAFNDIPESSYFDDSISDATDNSSDPTTSESRVLQVHSKGAERYLLKVVPTNRESYNIEFSCIGINHPPVDISANGVRINPNEEHSFIVMATPTCSNGFVFGGFEERTGSDVPLLTYAHPTSTKVHVASDNLVFHLVVVYGARITPSTFAATLDGDTITNRFQPKPNSIEAASVPVRPGHHVIQLSVSGISEQGAKVTTANSFIVEVD